MGEHIKIRLNNNVSFADDLREKGHLQFNPKHIQNPWELLVSCEYNAFRTLLQSIDLKHLVILVANTRLSHRVFLHLTEEAGLEVSYLWGRMNEISEAQEEEVLMQIDFESLFRKKQ